jgi:predicted O-methyltransferase YrrM
VRDGRVANATASDADVLGVRRLVDAMAAEPRIEVTTVQTVGSKGYDGFALGLVIEPPD